MDMLASNQSISNINSQAEARSVIRNGMTMDQVKEKLGNPNHRYTMNNRTVWSYTLGTINMNPITTLMGTGLPDTKSVAVTFNNRGRVISVDFTSMQNR